RPPESAVRLAADQLSRAARDRRPCAPVRAMLDPSPETGYAVQRLLTEEALREGRRIVGRKIGLTSTAVRRQVGVDPPDFGVLFADMKRDQGTTIDRGELLQPRIEAEVAFILSARLDQPELDLHTVAAAVEWVAPALEIVDSRIAGWDISLVDTVADNA